MAWERSTGSRRDPAVAEQAGNAVVGIGQRWGVGSGVVLGNGQVLTNAHNVRGDEVTVTFPDGHTATGRVLGLDVDGDVAVIGVDTGDLQAIEWATDGAPGIGAPSSLCRIQVDEGCASHWVSLQVSSAVSEGLVAAVSPEASSTMPRCYRFVRRAGSQPRGTTAGAEHAPAGRRLLPGDPSGPDSPSSGGSARPWRVEKPGSTWHRRSAISCRQGTAARRRSTGCGWAAGSPRGGRQSSVARRACRR